jgi:TnpA family transposase
MPTRVSGAGSNLRVVQVVSRIGGAGIMIHWHVQRGRVCVYYQLRTCSASEVAAMIEGLIRAPRSDNRHNP